MSGPEQNAIKDKLDELIDLWETFAETNKCLLRWLLEISDLEIVDLFFRMQLEEYSEIPDLFMTFDVPFEDIDNYPVFLRESLVRQYKEIKPDLKEEEIRTDWICPQIGQDETPLAGFIRCAASFQDHYKDFFRNFVIVLRPSAYCNVQLWQECMRRVVYTNNHSTVRFFVLEYTKSPLLNELQEKQLQYIETQYLDLDMASIMEDLAKGDGESPGSKFRVLFVKLSNQAAEGEIDKAEQTAELALMIARTHNWYQMQVVVFAALGAGYMQVQDTKKALRTYRQGTKVARAAIKAQDPAGPKLLIQCLFSEAGALFALQEHEEAAQVYQSVTPTAEAEEEHILALEGWRMAAYCYSEIEMFDAAINCGAEAIRCGEKIPEEERLASTLPYVGQVLIKTFEKERKKERRQIFSVANHGNRPYDDEDDVRRKMVSLCGPDWEDALKADAAAVANTGDAPA